MKPFLAMAQAVTAEDAAHPGCIRLVQAPPSKNSMTPEAIDKEIPNAFVSSPEVSFMIRPTNTVAPKIPTKPVG